MKKVLAVILAVAMLCTGFCLTSCNNTAKDPGSEQGNNDPSQSGDGRVVTIENNVITIGLIAPLTGPVAVYGISAKQGMELAVAEINKSEEILPGYTIELVIKDDQGDPTIGVSAFNSLLEGNMAALLGPITTGVTSAVTSLCNENEVVMITPSATGDSITTASDFVFRSCFKDSLQGERAAEYAKDLGIEKVAVLYASGDTYSKGLRDAFVNKCAELGIEVAVEMTSQTISDETTFSSQLTTIIDTIGKDGFLFAPYYYDAVGPMIVPEARNLGFTGIIMGSDGYDGIVPDYVTGNMENYNNVVFTNHYSSENTDEKVVNFISTYKEAYNENPTAFSALGYDAAYMLATAVEKAMKTNDGTVTVSGADVKAAMDGMTFAGVTGNFTLDATGTPEKSAVIIEYVYDADADTVTSKYVKTVG